MNMTVERESLKDIKTICLHCNQILEFRGDCNCPKTIELGKRTLSGAININERNKMTCKCGNIKFDPIKDDVYLKDGDIVTLFRCSECSNIIGKTEKNIK